MAEETVTNEQAPRPTDKKRSLRDCALIGILLVVVLTVLLFTFLLREKGGYVEVYQDGELLASYPLDLPREVTLNGGTNILKIEGGVAYLSYASCPDRTCVNTGKISYNGQSIVCLPNRLTIKVVSEQSGGVDFVS